MDNKTNQELFKQALVEGVSRRIDREIATCDEEITYSRRHIKNMVRIVNGKEIKKPLNRKMIAILVAAAILLLAGCAIIYRDEIREFITDIKGFFVEIEFSEGDNQSKYIEEVYELTYVPTGYELSTKSINEMLVRYIYKNEQGYSIKFMQQPLDVSGFAVDIEQGFYNTIKIEQYEVYYQQINTGYCYLWNDGKYVLKLNTTEQLSNELLKLMINGISIK